MGPKDRNEVSSFVVSLSGLFRHQYTRDMKAKDSRNDVLQAPRDEQFTETDRQTDRHTHTHTGTHARTHIEKKQSTDR